VLVLNNNAEVTNALGDPDCDLDLRVLIQRRAFELHIEDDRPLGDGVRFVVVEGGDTPEVINEAVGFPITGENAAAPNFEWMEDHGPWFEIAYDRDDDRRLFIFVEHGPATELGIHWLCLSHLWFDGEGSGR
jgi:hypothetical protein